MASPAMMQPIDKHTLTEILREHAKSDLTPEDRQALGKAARRFIACISLGALVGGGLGASVAMKGRYAFRNLRNLPPLYPEHLQGKIDRELVSDHLRFAFRSFLFFSGGAIVGSQLGGFVGIRSAKHIVNTEANYERIQEAIENTRNELKRRSRPGDQSALLEQQRRQAQLSGVDAEDGENTALAYHWASSEGEPSSSSSSSSPPVGNSESGAFEDDLAPKNVSELLVASQQPIAQQDFEVFQHILSRISSTGSLGMAVCWFAGVGLSFVGPFGLRSIRAKHGSFMYRSGMSQEDRVGLLKSQLVWAAKASFFSLFGLQAGASVIGPYALDKAWTEEMQQVRSRSDADDVRARMSAALRAARTNPVVPVPPHLQRLGMGSEAPQNSDSQSGAVTTPVAKSRWEELRSSKRPESSWDRIRNEQQQADQKRSQSSSSSTADETPFDRREREKEAFQKLMEQEQQGKDSFN